MSKYYENIVFPYYAYLFESNFLGKFQEFTTVGL